MDFALDFTFDAFKEDRKTIAACVFNISQIGELVKHINKKNIIKYPHIRWKAIRALRHKIVHDYEGIIVDLIWEVIVEDLPQLIIDLNMIIENEKTI